MHVYMHTEECQDVLTCPASRPTPSSTPVATAIYWSPDWWAPPPRGPWLPRPQRTAPPAPPEPAPPSSWPWAGGHWHLTSSRDIWYSVRADNLAPGQCTPRGEQWPCSRTVQTLHWELPYHFPTPHALVTCTGSPVHTHPLGTRLLLHCNCPTHNTRTCVYIPYFPELSHTFDHQICLQFFEMRPILQKYGKRGCGHLFRSHTLYTHACIESCYAAI